MVYTPFARVAIHWGAVCATVRGLIDGQQDQLSQALDPILQDLQLLADRDQDRGMEVLLCSGTVNTKDVSEQQISDLLSVLSFVDNCLEDGDIGSLYNNHNMIRELMLEIGLVIACER